MSDFSDRQLRAAFEVHRGEGDCELEAETLWALAAGELSPEEAARVVDLLSSSPACAEEYRLTRQMVAASRSAAQDESAEVDAPATEVPETEVPETEVPEIEGGAETLGFPGRGESPARSGRWRPLLALAAALVLAVGVWLSLDRSPDSPVYRQGEDEQRIETTLADGIALKRSQVVLSWTAIEGARYNLLITTEALAVVVEARFLEEASYRVDPGQLIEVPAGARLIWQVEALLPDGTRLSSDAFEVIVRN